MTNNTSKGLKTEYWRSTGPVASLLFFHGSQVYCIIPVFNIPDGFYSSIDPLPAPSSPAIWSYFPSISLQCKVSARVSEFPCKDRIFLWNPIYLDKQKQQHSSTKRRKMMLIRYMEKSPRWVRTVGLYYLRAFVQVPKYTVEYSNTTHWQSRQV